MSEQPRSRLGQPERAASLSTESASESAPPAALLEWWLAVAADRETRFVKAWPVRGACMGWFDAPSAVAPCVPRRVVTDNGAEGARRRRRDGS